MKDFRPVIVVSPDPDERAAMVARVAVSNGFARTPGDARKIVKGFTHDFDLNSSYFILAATHNFEHSEIPFSKLYSLSVQGVCVVVGSKRVPTQWRDLCKVLYPVDFK